MNEHAEEQRVQMLICPHRRPVPVASGSMSNGICLRCRLVRFFLNHRDEGRSPRDTDYWDIGL